MPKDKTNPIKSLINEIKKGWNEAVEEARRIEAEKEARITKPEVKEKTSLSIEDVLNSSLNRNKRKSKTTKVNRNKSKSKSRKKETYKCSFWSCKKQVSKEGHSFCYEHWLDFEAGYIDDCPKCRRGKNVEYEYCLECENKKSPSPSKKYNKYAKEHSIAWEKADKERSVWYVYILELDDGSFYAGQTGELRERMMEHRMNKENATKNRNPKLKWFAPVGSRNAAEEHEIELKKLIDNNPRAIVRRIIAFQDLINEVS